MGPFYLSKPQKSPAYDPRPFSCNGGYPDEAFTFWRWSGVVTGSNFTDKAGCKPYPFKNCEHHTDAKTYPPCGGAMERTPRCQKSCQTGYSVHPYNKDQSYGLKTLNIRANPAAVQKELMENGPLVFTFHVFEDFLTYKSGVYEVSAGQVVQQPTVNQFTATDPSGPRACPEKITGPVRPCQLQREVEGVSDSVWTSVGKCPNPIH